MINLIKKCENKFQILYSLIIQSINASEKVTIEFINDNDLVDVLSNDDLKNIKFVIPMLENTYKIAASESYLAKKTI